MLRRALFGFNNTNNSQPAAYNSNNPVMIPYMDYDIDPVWYNWDCTLTESGNYVRADAPPANVSAFPRMVFHSMEELLEHPGIYAWILFSDNSFAAARTFSPQEILSKHKNLHRNRADQGILAAGECRILEKEWNGEGGRVEFNLLSGTYMVHILKRFSKRFPDFNGTQWYAQQIGNLWERAGAVTVAFTESEIIPKVATEAELAQYAGIGYRFQRFPTIQACQASTMKSGGGRKRRGHRRRVTRRRKTRL